MVNPTKVEDMSSILQQYDLNILGMTRGYQRNGDVDENDRKFALNLSMNADIVIFCFGLDDVRFCQSFYLKASYLMSVP